MQNILVKGRPFRHHRTPGKTVSNTLEIPIPEEVSDVLFSSDTSDSDESNSTDLVADTMKMYKNTSTARRHQSMLVGGAKEGSKWLT